MLWPLSWTLLLFFKHVVKWDSLCRVTFSLYLGWWWLCNHFPLWWTLKSSWGTIWSKQVFPAGDLCPAHMLSFKHLNGRLGLPARSFLLIFEDPEKDRQLSSRNWRSDLLSRTIHSLSTLRSCFFFFYSVHVFTGPEEALFLSVLHFFFPMPRSAQACWTVVSCGPH